MDLGKQVSIHVKDSAQVQSHGCNLWDRNISKNTLSLYRPPIMCIWEVTIHVVMNSPYTVMIKLYGTHMTIYLEKEKIKVLGLVGPVGKREVICPPLWYTLVLWVWELSYLLFMTPLVDLWSFILLGPNTLIMRTFNMMTFILWFLFLDHW